MECRRCGGSGWLSIKLGRPGSDRHKAYLDVWCIHPPRRCAVCYGSGTERFKNNPRAGWRIHLDEQGIPTKRSAVADESEDT